MAGEQHRLFHPAQAGIRSNLNLSPRADTSTRSAHGTQQSDECRTRSQNLCGTERRIRCLCVFVFCASQQWAAVGYVSAGAGRRIEGTRKPSAPRPRNQIRTAQAQSAEQDQPFSLQLRNETPVRLSPRHEGGKRGHPDFRHLPRRLIHYLKCGAERKSPLLSKSRRQTQPDLFPIEKGV